MLSGLVRALLSSMASQQFERSDLVSASQVSVAARMRTIETKLLSRTGASYWASDKRVAESEAYVNCEYREWKS